MSSIYSPVTVSDSKGVRSLYFGSKWIQGSMRLGQPDAIELEYVRRMMAWVLFAPSPGHIVQLGLGAASLTKFCYRNFAHARVTAVERNAAVIALCESQFALPPNDARLNVIHADAMDFVMQPAYSASLDVLQVDLYDADAGRPALDTPEFYLACSNCLSADGIMTVNILGNDSGKSASLQAIEQAFEAVAWLPETPDGNVVAIAFRRAPQIDFTTLYERATAIHETLSLPARAWVDGLQLWMQGE